jgi:phosphoribosylformimino-5-aminoimidazole carboxamide ribotide isomerase
MILYPAMDLMGGKVVRLAQGRFEDATTYASDPAEALAAFAAAGAAWAHVVDLDGARARKPVQHDLIARLAAKAPLKLQVAGGFRERDQLARMFDAGVGRVVIGSLAVEDPVLTQALLDEFGGDRITFAFDVKVEGGYPLVYTRGWTHYTGLDAITLARRYRGGRHLLVTDIAKDGMLRGPNFALLAELQERLPEYDIQASGGVTSLEDLRELTTSGVILGRALWEGRIDLKDALDACA